MNNSLSGILARHESEDKNLTGSDAFLRRMVDDEFANSAALLSAAEKYDFSPADFFAGKRLPDGIELPVRTSARFYVKKHTSSLRPYMHSHDFCELIYVQRGSLAQTLQGGRVIRLGEGQCCMIRPGTAHCLGRAGREDVVLKAVVPQPLFCQIACGVPLPADGCTVFCDISPFARSLFIRLLGESAFERPAKEQTVRALLTLLLCELVRGNIEERDAGGSALFLEEYFACGLRSASLNNFAQKYGYSPAYASRLIKKRTGKNFSELVTGRRLQMAARLLSSTDMSVEDVAYEVGYKVPSALYKQFAACFGMTPSEYRSALGST